MNRRPQPFQFPDEKTQAAVTASRELRGAIVDRINQPEGDIIQDPEIADLGRTALVAWDNVTGELGESAEHHTLMVTRCIKDPSYESRLLELLADVL